MKRDMELIRKLALFIEFTEPPIFSNGIEFEGFTNDQIGYHCELMKDGGLIRGDVAGQVNFVYSAIQIHGLSWSGHDFLDAARNETVWNTVNSKIKDTAISVTFDGLKSLLKQAGQQGLKHGTDWLLKTDWEWVQYFTT